MLPLYLSTNLGGKLLLLFLIETNTNSLFIQFLSLSFWVADREFVWLLEHKVSRAVYGPDGISS